MHFAEFDFDECLAHYFLPGLPILLPQLAHHGIELVCIMLCTRVAVFLLPADQILRPALIIYLPKFRRRSLPLLHLAQVVLQRLPANFNFGKSVKRSIPSRIKVLKVALCILAKVLVLHVVICRAPRIVQNPNLKQHLLLL